MIHWFVADKKLGLKFCACILILDGHQFIMVGQTGVHYWYVVRRDNRKKKSHTFSISFLFIIKLV